MPKYEQFISTMINLFNARENAAREQYEVQIVWTSKIKFSIYLSILNNLHAEIWSFRTTYIRGASHVELPSVGLM